MIASALRVLAPAKLNLFACDGRRADGYHALQTAFTMIDFCDVLDIAVLGRKNLPPQSLCRGGTGKRFLVIRAARLLQTESGASLAQILASTNASPWAAVWAAEVGCRRRFARP